MDKLEIWILTIFSAKSLCTWRTKKADKIYRSSGRQRKIPSLLLCKKWICMWHLFYTFLHNSSEEMFLCLREELYILSAFFVSHVHSECIYTGVTSVAMQLNMTGCEQFCNEIIVLQKAILPSHVSKCVYQYARVVNEGPCGLASTANERLMQDGLPCPILPELGCIYYDLLQNRMQFILWVPEY